MKRLVISAIALLTVTGCAVAPLSAPGERGPVRATAPSLAAFAFGQPELAPAAEFERWQTMATRAQDGDVKLDACIADKAACATADLIRFRKLLEVARQLTAKQQLNLVQAYFNAVVWTGEDRDTWLPLYDVAAERHGDCEDVALAKYATLRRLGWAATDLRVVVGWDNEERDWHAWLLVQHDGAPRVLDSIKDVQNLRHFRAARAVYSVSELGFWDHAPDFVPVSTSVMPERAARLAAMQVTNHNGAP